MSMQDLSEQTPVTDPAGPAAAQGTRVRPARSLMLGDYRILQKLGAGSGGAVYLAHQLSAGREVALKVLDKDLARKPVFVERFYREARVMAALDHPAIVRCHGAGEERGYHYLAMEFVKGASSSVLLRRLGRFEVGDALHIAIRCAEALQYAHERRVVHRDIKPDNILITPQRTVKIADLGLAKCVDDPSLTETGIGLGTPRYMAPEQARNAKHADHRCDVYALGSVLYRFLTGRLPFEGATPVDLILAKERGGYPPARRVNPAVPRLVERILARMLAAAPDDRYRGCGPLLRDLEGLGLASTQLGFDPMRVAYGLPPEDAPAPREALSVLLVHDDRDYLLLTREALQAGHVSATVKAVEDGREALAALQESRAAPPGLIVVGLSQPTQGSLDVLAAIRADDVLGAVPLVVLTVAAEAIDVLRACGVTETCRVIGPDDLQPLVETVRSLRPGGGAGGSSDS
jgi:CheY-like chemotaxis protein